MGIDDAYHLKSFNVLSTWLQPMLVRLGRKNAYRSTARDRADADLSNISGYPHRTLSDDPASGIAGRKLTAHLCRRKFLLLVLTTHIILPTQISRMRKLSRHGDA